MKKISVIVPIRNEEKYIEECLNSIINFEYPKEYLEVIFVDGMSDDKTIDILMKCQKEHNYIKIISNEEKIVPIAMNLGIKHSTGEYICRLDAHAKYPSNYLNKLLEWSEKLDADNVGAVCITSIKSKTNIARAIQFVMSDKFGVGNSLFRTGVDKVMEVDTVPFGFYKKEVFERIGLYNEFLIRTQDLELNKRLKEKNGKIFLIPDVQCEYFPRENIIDFYKNRFNTGLWVILSSYYAKSIKSVSIRHLVPMLFSIIFLGTFFLGLFNSKLFSIFFIIFFSYSSFLFLRSFIFKKKNFLLSLNILLLYFILHISYGLGSIKGIFKVLFGIKK